MSKESLPAESANHLAVFQETAPVAFYSGLLAEIKQRVRQGQARAILAVNQELLALYWDIGCLIDARQKEKGWGAGVIPRLAKGLHNELPEEKGFSERNIKLMVQFYREYPTLFVSEAIGQPAVAQLPDSVSQPEKGQPLLAQIPWAHNVLLMQRVKDRGTRLWYAEATLAQGWSRNVLQMQIETAAHMRQGEALCWLRNGRRHRRGPHAPGRSDQQFRPAPASAPVRSGAAGAERPLPVRLSDAGGAFP